MTRIIAISNQKGGVGKTTTAINLSAALARLGHPVLLIDLDPQGNASSGVGVERTPDQAGLLEVLLRDASINDVVVPTSVEGLDLVPATASLLGAEVELAPAIARELRLREALKELPSKYSYVVMDCPPSLGLLTVNAFTAADAVLVPVQVEYFALEGLGQLMRTMAEVRKVLNPRLTREGLLLTMHDPRNNLCRQVEEQVREVFKGEVFETVIPRNVRLGEAPSHGVPALDYDPTCKGSVAYIELAKNLLDRHGLRAQAREAM